MYVTRGRSTLTSELTVDEDLDFLTLYQAIRLATPAAVEALRMGEKDITNAEVSDSAAIAESKLALAKGTQALFDKIGVDIGTHAGLPTVHQDAPSLITTHDGLAAPHTAAAFVRLTVAETEVFNGTSPTSWTDLNMSGTIGAQATLVLIKVFSPQIDTYGFRRNGDTDDRYDPDSRGCNNIYITANDWVYAVVVTDTAGIIEWKSASARTTVTIDVIAYIK